MASAKGAYLTDLDGNSYIDYIGSWGPMILGHAFEPVLDAIQGVLKGSTSFGAPTARESEMAELICATVPGVEKVRMVNSGTEACLSAIRVARGYTGRHKIIKCEGCYHGHADSFLIAAGSGVATLGIPGSPGVTPGTAADTLTAPYNDFSAIEALVAANPNQIAALIVEPVAGNMGCIPPREGYLAGLRHLCERHGIVLIFDEVMTGFRLALGGASERYGVTADLVTLGKIIGAGLPVGAYGGRREIMDTVAPQGKVYQAGTLSGNPVAMAAGLALLRHLHTHRDTIYPQLDAAVNLFAQEIRQLLSKFPNISHQVNQVGSMLSVHFCENPVVDYASAQAQDVAGFNRWFHALLNKGIYLPPSAYESWFVSAAHAPDEFSYTLAAMEAALVEAFPITS
jgi:glutamate-1-semialdehyde 2,1-aminomutase